MISKSEKDDLQVVKIAVKLIDCLRIALTNDIKMNKKSCTF